jgi:halocyanin-like protein
MSTEQAGTGVSRRGFLRTTAGGVAAGAALTAAGGAAAQSGEDFDGYLSDTGNYDGTVVDERGADQVTVDVGASGNNGPFAFEPAAVRVDPGAEVVWEWTGEGGQHNVVDEAGGFESDLTAEAGFTYSRTVDEPGVTKYFCAPHKSLGMKGVVVVGDVDVGGGGEDGGGTGGDGGASGDGGTGGEDGDGDHGGGGDEPDEPSAGNQTAANTLLVMLGLGFLSPVVFAILLRWQRPKGPVE